MMAFVSASRFLFILFLACICCHAAPGTNADSVVVVYNKNDQASIDLAKYYAQRRNIPEGHLVGLSCPLTEEISRADYVATIAEPLRKLFKSNKWWPGSRNGGMRFVALIRGMPLKIAPTTEGVTPAPNQPLMIASRTEASVDSELTCLTLEDMNPAGLMGNPYYNSVTPALEVDMYPPVLLVSRLDAANEISVRAMIDDSIATERSGLWGWAYIDIRNIQDPGYKIGDDWLRAAAASMRAKGIPVLVDNAPETIPAGVPLTDAAIYYGWYAANICGPFADPAFRFRPGAVAVHIHSFSAATLRSATSGWCAPLIEHGAAATLGNCYEPALMLTAQIDTFQDRLMAGLTLAESAWMSTRALSWVNVVIGDPLYRPYATWSNPAVLDGQANNAWKKYRNIVRANGSVLASQTELLAAARDFKNSMFLEALASAQMDGGEMGFALKTLSQAIELDANPVTRFRLMVERIEILRHSGQIRSAEDLLRQAQNSKPSPAQASLLQSIYLKIHPPSPTPKPLP